MINILFTFIILLILTIRILNYVNTNFFNQFFYSLIIFILLHFYLYKVESLYFNSNIYIHLFLYFLFFFFYAGIRKSISVKMINDLYKNTYTFNAYFKIFKKNSYEDRIEILINNGSLLKYKDNKYFFSKRILKFRLIFKNIQKIFGIKNSG